MFEPMFKPNPPPYLNKAGKNARQVQKRECFSQPLKERLDKGREMQHRNDSEREGEDLILKDSRMYKNVCKKKKEKHMH